MTIYIVVTTRKIIIVIPTEVQIMKLLLLDGTIITIKITLNTHLKVMVLGFVKIVVVLVGETKDISISLTMMKHLENTTQVTLSY